MKATDLVHKFEVGDTVRYRAEHISGDGSRQHHYNWRVGVVEALGWSKPTYKTIETGEVVETVNKHGLVSTRKVREDRKVRLPLYKVAGRWTAVRKA
jgi:hypothetical protein